MKTAILLCCLGLSACGDVHEVSPFMCGREVCSPGQHCVGVFGHDRCVWECHDDCACCVVGHSGDLWCVKTRAECDMASCCVVELEEE